MSVSSQKGLFLFVHKARIVDAIIALCANKKIKIIHWWTLKNCLQMLVGL